MKSVIASILFVTISAQRACPDEVEVRMTTRPVPLNRWFSKRIADQEYQSKYFKHFNCREVLIRAT